MLVGTIYAATHNRVPSDPQKNTAGHQGRRALMSLTEVLLPILLDARGAQAGEAVLVDRVLPGEEFLDRERVAAARFLEREQATADRGDDLGLAPDDPALGARCRQVGDRQRASIRPDDVFGPWSKGLIHEATHALD